MSTVKSPDARFVSSGYSTGMDLPLILSNIEWRLKVLKLSANRASDLAGTPDAIRNLRRRVAGKAGGSFTVDTLQKLAVALKCEPKDLMQATPQENVKPIPGLRGQLLSQLAYLDTERDRVLRQLDALETAELPAEKPRKRKIR
jgi:hypothetical protein